MAASSLDIELSKYWAMLSPEQKTSLLEVIKSFMQSSGRISVEQYNQELAESESEYEVGNHITSEEMLQLIRHSQAL